MKGRREYRLLRAALVWAGWLAAAVPGLTTIGRAQSPQSASPAASSGAQTLQAAEADPILHAMLQELARNKADLHLPHAAAPYFIEFRLEDQATYRASSSFGALTRTQEGHVRLAHVRVHVGSYKVDNSHVAPAGQLGALLAHFGLGGDGAAAVEVIDDDPVALRYGLWSAADAAYKRAVDDLTKRQTELKSVQTSSEVDDFSQEKPFISLQPVRALSFDRGAWTGAVVQSSGLMFSDAEAKAFAPEIEEANGTVEGRVRTEYLVNTEGTIVRKSHTAYHAEVTFQAQAADGMRLERAVSASGLTADEMGTAERFRTMSLHGLEGLHALCKAPVVGEEYHGPVLLEGNAAARTFDGAFARAVEARSPAAGGTARISGAYATSLHTRVLPDFLTVADDPTLTRFADRAIFGSYTVDDEGVPAQKVTLVDAGKLVSYDIGREPVRDLPQSNGHGRAGEREAPSPHIGVLQVQASEGLSDEDLVKKLLAMGKDQGLAYVYIVETLGGPNQPRVLDRVDVNTGGRQLVRGGALEDLDLRALRSGIVAAGNKPAVYNTFGDVPTTVIAPALLVEDVTVKRAGNRNTHLPYLPAPTE